MSNGIYQLTGGRAATHPPQSPFRIFAATTTGREKNVIRQELISIACWRLDDVRFAFGSSFVAPAARAEFEALARVCEAHATAPISVFGHADPVGEDKKNKILSGQRAEVIYAILTHDAERWERICKDAGWPATHMQEIAEALQFETIAAFQKANGLYEDGIAGPRTRAKLFPQYFDYLFPKPLPKSAFLGQGASANGKGAYQGCGEFNPAMLFAKAENDEFAQSGNNAKRDEANAVNRRVIVLFFRPGTVIPGDKWPCPTAAEGVDGCRRRFWSDGEKRRSFQENRRKFEESFDTFACRFYHRLVVSSPCEAALAPDALVSRFALSQLEGVAKMFGERDFYSWLLVHFGSDIPTEALVCARDMLLEGSFPNCEIRLTDSGIYGHTGAYDRKNKAILISRSAARSAETDNFASLELAGILVEEFGHFVDDQLRSVLSEIGGDASFDEGAIFGYSIANFKHDIDTETTIGEYCHGGSSTELRIRYAELQKATAEFFSEQNRMDDARTEQFEFFGAGAGVHRHGQGQGASYGHESIEFGLENCGFTDSLVAENSELKRIYFGNWLRDYSQVVDPKLVRPKDSDFVFEGLLRGTWTRLIDLLSRAHFGNSKVFQVDDLRLGVYRPEEHIDNPAGIVDSQWIDPAFRKACDAVELDIDLTFGLKKYIRTSGLPRDAGPSTAAEFMTAELAAAVSAGRTTAGFRHLGSALHTIEDYFAHSNFVELALIELGYPDVYPWAGTPISGAKDVTLNGKFPVVTGSFGGWDTAVSVLDALGESLQQAKPCEPGERGFAAKVALILLEDAGQSTLAKKVETTLTKFEDLLKENETLATFLCKTVGAALNWIGSIIGALIVHATEGVAEAQKAFADDLSSNDPTHSMLAKDHDAHPLHISAAELARIASQDIANVVNLCWSCQTTTETPSEAALKYLVHPAALRARSCGMGAPLIGGLKNLWDKLEAAWCNADSASKVQRIEGRKWMLEQYETSKKELEEIVARARKIDPKKAEAEVERLLKRLEEFEKELKPRTIKLPRPM